MAYALWLYSLTQASAECWSRRLLCWPPFKLLGEMSFSFYVLSMPIMEYYCWAVLGGSVWWTKRYVAPVDMGAWHAVPLVLLQLLCAYLSLRLVEAPMRSTMVGWLELARGVVCSRVRPRVSASAGYVYTNTNTNINQFQSARVSESVQGMDMPEPLLLLHDSGGGGGGGGGGGWTSSVADGLQQIEEMQQLGSGGGGDGGDDGDAGETGGSSHSSSSSGRSSCGSSSNGSSDSSCGGSSGGSGGSDGSSGGSGSGSSGSSGGGGGGGGGGCGCGGGTSVVGGMPFFALAPVLQQAVPSISSSHVKSSHSSSSTSTSSSTGIPAVQAVAVHHAEPVLDFETLEGSEWIPAEATAVPVAYQ